MFRNLDTMRFLCEDLLHSLLKLSFVPASFSSVDARGAALKLLPFAYVAHDCFDWCPLR